MKFVCKKWNKPVPLFLMGILLLVQSPVWAAGAPVPSEMRNPTAQLLVGIIVALLLVIVLLAYVVTGAAELYLERYREKKQSGSKISIWLLLGLGSMMSIPAMAQEQTQALVPQLSSTSLNTLIAVIIIELCVIFYLLINLRTLLSKEKEVVKPAKPSFSFAAWWDQFNRFRPVQEEANIDLGHDYDGIRELDNRLPPWWLYGFYACIVFAGVYLWRYHVSHTGALSAEEYQIAVTKAAEEKEAYLAKAANKVDETTVVYQTSSDYLAGGQKIFITACAPCHLADGGGSVGPNLTDDYFLHGNDIKDIFKTIKYGYPEKGMKSWQDDYTPSQIAQLASYVKSLIGKKPSKPKEPQGILIESKEPTVADSSKVQSSL